jgi:hypothetical protein
VAIVSNPSLSGDLAGRVDKLGCPVGKLGCPVGKLGGCPVGKISFCSTHNSGCVVYGIRQQC